METLHVSKLMSLSRSIEKSLPPCDVCALQVIVLMVVDIAYEMIDKDFHPKST